MALVEWSTVGSVLQRTHNTARSQESIKSTSSTFYEQTGNHHTLLLTITCKLVCQCSHLEGCGQGEVFPGVCLVQEPLTVVVNRLLELSFSNRL